MAVEEIAALVPPPKKPVWAGTEKSWRDVEKQLSFPLPSDYRAYIDTYGSGDLGDMFYVLSPFEMGGSFLDHYGEINSDLIEFAALEGWLDEAGGDGIPRLILFGGDTNGNYLHWLTVGEPDEWPIIIGGGRSFRITRYPGPFSSFLAGVLRHEVATDRYSPNIVKRQFTPTRTN